MLSLMVVVSDFCAGPDVRLLTHAETNIRSHGMTGEQKMPLTMIDAMATNKPIVNGHPLQNGVNDCLDFT